MAACLSNLKLNLRAIEAAFPNSDSKDGGDSTNFKIIQSTVDELTLRFTSPTGRKIDIHANFTVSIAIMAHNLTHGLPITLCHVTNVELFFLSSFLHAHENVINCYFGLMEYLPFQETYPSTPPVWFSEAEDAFVGMIVQALSESSGSDNYVSNLFSPLLLDTDLALSYCYCVL